MNKTFVLLFVCVQLTSGFLCTKMILSQSSQKFPITPLVHSSSFCSPLRLKKYNTLPKAFKNSFFLHKQYQDRRLCVLCSHEVSAFGGRNSKNGGDCKIESLQHQLKSLEYEIFSLNNATKFNLASPKQVANVVYGPQDKPNFPGLSEENIRSRSTNKQSLEALLKSSNLNFSRANSANNKHAILEKILQWRSLHAIHKRQYSSSAKSTSIPNSETLIERKTKDISSKNDLIDHSHNIFDSNTQSFNHDMSPLEMHIHSLFLPENEVNNNFYQIDPFWKRFLMQVDKPSAKSIIFQLHSHCPMGYNPNATPLAPQQSITASSTSNNSKKGSLLDYVREQKRRFPDAIILTRVGEFYEAFGIDAIALMQCCGLNPMAGKGRAGCPYKNIQATLDGLTSCGFRVAVIEEASDTDSIKRGAGASGGSKSRLKNRMLAQMVSSASPTYMYDLVLQDDGDMMTQSTFGNNIHSCPRHHVGVINASSGYAIVEISLEERCVRVSERLTSEAVACRLSAYPPADPLFYVAAPGEEKSKTNLPFLPSRHDAASDGPGSTLRIHLVPGGVDLMPDPRPGISDVERAKSTILSALLKLSESKEGDINTVSENDFVLVGSETVHQGQTYTNPLYVETATQLGLMNDPSIPSLIKSILPESAPISTKRFLRRWLLTPSPPTATDAMASLVKELKDNNIPLPPLSVPPVGKVVSLIRAGQASALVYREILSSLDAATAILDSYSEVPHKDNVIDCDIVSPLMILLKHETGLAADPFSLYKRCIQAKKMIEDVVNTEMNSFNSTYSNLDSVSDTGDLIPSAFFERNELVWRGKVKRKAAENAYTNVENATTKLAVTVAKDFWGAEDYCNEKLQNPKEVKSPIVQDVFDNKFAIKVLPTWVKSDDQVSLQYFHTRDRNGKIQRNRYTTERVETALLDYVEACSRACNEVKAILVELSQSLCEEGHLPALVQAAHLNLILSSAVHHAARANSLGWGMAKIIDLNDQKYSYSTTEIRNSACYLENVWPYWMAQSQAVNNSFELNGLFLLTAPNMSGKSTLMRSTAAAALLTNCGLCAPLHNGSHLRRFDSIFVRGASADVPTEGKSAFGAEMGDIAAMMRSCGHLSLVFVDELGRGTSPKDGTVIAGAVLEEMAAKRMSGIFATHLHGILNLPLKETALDRIERKRMAISTSDGEHEWKYLLEDGVCIDSMALVTAAKFGLPGNILQRAEDLATSLPETMISPSSDDDGQPIIQDGCIKKFLNTMESNDTQSLNLDDAIRAVEHMIGSKFETTQIPPSWMSPSSLEGRTCVYILEIRKNALASNRYSDPTDPLVTAQYYVGETDSLSRRLKQHRSKGGDWAGLKAAAIPVSGGKSEARNIESLLIQKMSRMGFDMISVSDGRSVRNNQQRP